MILSSCLKYFVELPYNVDYYNQDAEGLIQDSYSNERLEGDKEFIFYNKESSSFKTMVIHQNMENNSSKTNFIMLKKVLRDKKNDEIADNNYHTEIGIVGQIKENIHPVFNQ